MTSCAVDTKLVPLMNVVKAAMVDMWADVGSNQEMFMHFAARELDQLQQQILKRGKRSVLIQVNKNTNTAALPIDFDSELFVGVINQNHYKVPLRLNTRITDTINIQQLDYEEKCDKCNQNKGICEDLQITEEVVFKKINDETYEQRIVKKLYPNGDYFLETTTPVWNVGLSDVEYVTNKEFVSHFDLKQCGCLETSLSNISNIEKYCPEVYSHYYAPCDYTCSEDYGGYKIFEESGLIQFDFGFKFNYVYLEYLGFIPKKNGQYYVPKVAFETLVEGVKFRSIEGRKNFSNADKVFRWQRYLTAKANMQKILGRVTLSSIVQAATLVPKFDTTKESWYDVYCHTNSTINTSVFEQAQVCENNVTAPTVSTVISIGTGAYKILEVSGSQLNDNLEYTNPSLGGMDLLVFANYIPKYLDKGTEFQLIPNGIRLLGRDGTPLSDDDKLFITINGKL